MDKKADPRSNSMTHLPLPFGDINNRRFVTAVLAGILGGAGVSAGANLLRQFRELRQKRKEETDNETIVLNLPRKVAEGAFESMQEARSGESKPTAGGGTQLRDNGRFGKKIVKDVSDTSVADSPTEKTAEGNPGPNTVGTIVANTLGLTAGGLLSYEVVSRLFDRMNERRLKRKLEAAQQAYIDALSGASKRAEAVNRIISPIERVICKSAAVKSADAMDLLRYPAAAYILTLLAGTGATAYVTKKVMDREFPEEKLKADINRPTRIVFRTAPGEAPTLREGEAGEEKTASAETCAALTAMLPIYMDAVEGQPSRTLAAPYQKIAEAAGTDAQGLMKMALTDMSRVYWTVLKDPKALWEILKATNFGLNFSKRTVADTLKRTSPDTYRRAVDAAIDAHTANSPNAGFFQRGWNAIQNKMFKLYANNGGRDKLVDKALGPKAAEVKEADGAISTLAALVLPGGIPGSHFAEKAQAAGGGRFGNTIKGALGGGAVNATLAGLLTMLATRGMRGTGVARRVALAAGIPSLIGGGLTGMTYGRKQTVTEAVRSALEKIKPMQAAAPVKAAASDDLLRASYIGSAVLGGGEPEKQKQEEPEPTKSIIAKAKKGLKAKRKVTVEAADPNAAAFVARRKDIIRKLLARLNAQGAI